LCFSYHLHSKKKGFFVYEFEQHWKTFCGGGQHEVRRLVHINDEFLLNKQLDTPSLNPQATLDEYDDTNLTLDDQEDENKPPVFCHLDVSDVNSFEDTS
jgi:hypothetical protein